MAKPDAISDANGIKVVSNQSHSRRSDRGDMLVAQQPTAWQSPDRVQSRLQIFNFRPGNERPFAVHNIHAIMFFLNLEQHGSLRHLFHSPD
jgi:hypothetical protein